MDLDIQGLASNNLINILNNSEKFGFITVKNIENKFKCDSWNEYRILLEAAKLEDNPKYLPTLFKTLSDLIDSWKLESNIDAIGIQDVDSSNAGFYYITLFVLESIGKDEVEEGKDENTFDLWME